MIGLLSAAMICGSMLVANAAEQNNSIVKNTNDTIVVEDYWTTDAFGDSMFVMFTYKYSDGNSVYRTGFTHSANNRTWSENVSDNFFSDTLYSTATLTCYYSFSCSAWCDIYGQSGH
ncbi:MAG: hypothetical protein HDR02_00430 [Lachnospiraceae bacterium]|nr:hypothetical protein [Lachnospiraceae bacterium]